MLILSPPNGALLTKVVRVFVATAIIIVLFALMGKSPLGFDPHLELIATNGKERPWKQTTYGVDDGPNAGEPKPDNDERIQDPASHAATTENEQNPGPKNIEDWQLLSPPKVPPASQPTHPMMRADELKATDKKNCVPFEQWMKSRPGPLSEGKRQFPYVRPPPECRAFHVPELEEALRQLKSDIKDPDLYRLFENAYPMTLDTMVKWRGYANNSDEELAYIITGDIDAMWLRDSASQIYSYASLLRNSSDPNSLASLWRGVINSQARYILISPYCHSFQPPPESGIPPTRNGAFSGNKPMPPYDPQKVFDCKWELDSLASFLQISATYFDMMGDYQFFQKYNWISAVEAILEAAGAMRLGTYASDGKVQKSAYTFTGWTNRGSETLTNDGLGNPSKENGMVRTSFRPSDDATIFQFLVPANMMFAAYLESASEIMEKLDDERASNLTEKMREFAKGIRRGIEQHAIVNHPGFGNIFAYEVDGFGSVNLMDDANIPSLLAMPLWSFIKEKDDTFYNFAEIYRNTRRFVLSDSNPYFMKGPVISAIGGPHVGPGKAWPMAAVTAGLTAYGFVTGLDNPEAEVGEYIQMVLDSTTGSGVLHESVNSWDEQDFTRPWFGWANGLFGELILTMFKYERAHKMRGLLGKSWQ